MGKYRKHVVVNQSVDIFKSVQLCLKDIADFYPSI